MVVMMNNELAYKGNQMAREALYELHIHEDASAPAVRSATVDGARTLANATVSASPVIAIRFSTQVEARSLNYNSVRLTRAGDNDPQRIPMRIDADGAWTTFTVSPREPLSPGAYLLRVGDGAAPVSVAGLVQIRTFSATFRVDPG
jgi:hypothetical protein